ncbi:N-acetylmuramoyl-L-alanine amidase [Aquimarina sp. RZ0]|uniref:N-acetylmuramoyl-L-alanine amidase n=1 Tax=Aquimarina sp. RZ0 TaxID=2607730 RepID=UPI00165FCE1D|nr:N-acetylmuramoyl-L-alanine amidase [Aquimarina sp. RZ0]
MWPSAYWAYHLGSCAIGGNTSGSKRTIAIEISNIGFLKRIDDKLVTVYNDNDVYCDINQTQLCTKLASPYRGELYYATFTKQQYDSVLILLRYLTATYSIPRKFLSEDKRYITGDKNELINFRGIVSHVNYRSSRKWDIGPAFDWGKIIDGIL